MLRAVTAAITWLAFTGLALAQSSPNLQYGQVPSPAQWNSYFSGKMDYSGTPACLLTGCSFSGSITVPALIGSGTPPPNTGTCPIISQAGGNTIGIFTQSGNCANGTYIFTFATTAPNGWACDAEDRSTKSDAVQQGSSTTTTATFSSNAGNGDIISFKCFAY
jgi:hypothetical protein